MLFLIDNKINIFSKFYDSKNLFKGNNFTSTTFGNYFLNFNYNSSNMQIKNDVKNIIKKINLDLNFIALKTKDKEFAFKDLW